MASITGIFSRSGNGFLEQRRECCGALRGLSHSEFALAYRDQAVLLHGSGAEAGPEPPSRPGASIVSPFVLIGAATIYNRSELVSEVGLDRNSASDLDLLRGAYAQWGAACPSRMLGDWAFAAWHPKERRLFLARDQSGATSLYYYADTDVFIFSTSRRTLLNLKLASVELDELYLAQILVSWFAYQGERTIHSPIKRLPFAHCLTVTPDRLDLRQYWRLDDTAERHLPGRQDCVAALRDVFDRAVRERLPAAGTLAATLSGGLNSGAIAVTAAEMLRHRGQRLDAYISVPLSDPSRYVAQGSGDEFSLAQCTAKTAANIDLHRIEARGLSPIRAIRDVLDICLEPLHAAANLYWSLELLRTAARDGHTRILIGQSGNAGISWSGDYFSQPLSVQLRNVGMRRWLGGNVRKLLPNALTKLIRRRWRSPNWQASAIAPEFASRIRLFERRLDDPWETSLLMPRMQRLHMLGPDRSIGGFLHAELGAACGLAATDPMADVRVLSFCLSVPDHVFIDPVTGMDRWLVREAMNGRLPDAVRLNRQRGSQASDLVPRLRACRDEVEAVLEEISSGPALGYLDLAHMRLTWARVEAESNKEVYRLAVTVLLRGIMAGLFINGLGKTW